MLIDHFQRYRKRSGAEHQCQVVCFLSFETGDPHRIPYRLGNPSLGFHLVPQHNRQGPVDVVAGELVEDIPALGGEKEVHHRPAGDGVGAHPGIPNVVTGESELFGNYGKSPQLIDSVGVLGIHPTQSRTGGKDVRLQDPTLRTDKSAGILLLIVAEQS